MLTKKHFIALADHIREFNKPEGASEPFSEYQIGTLADFCEEQNPQFNRQRWLDYVDGFCGPSGGKLKKVSS